MKYKYPCPECKGSGQTLIPLGDYTRGMKVEKCKVCNGFGWFESDALINNMQMKKEKLV